MSDRRWSSIKIRFKEGYKKNSVRRAKERNFKKNIKHEYIYINRQYTPPRGGGNVCTFRGYYIDEREILKQTNKYTRRYEFKTPKYYRRVKRYCLNRSVEDINITSLGRNYRKIISGNA